MIRIWLLVVAAVAACIPPKTTLAPAGPVTQADAGRFASVPRFVLMPAQDRRPVVERTGHAAEYGLMVSTAAIVTGVDSIDFRRASGATVLTTAGLTWTPVTIRAGRSSVSFTMDLTPSLAMSVASDVGRALASATGRPTEISPIAPAQIAQTAEDGTVIVSVIVDHFTQIEPVNATATKLTAVEGTRRRMTVATADVGMTDSLGVFWVVAFQIELAEVRGHQIARRLVRYAAASSKESSSYSTAIAATAGEIVDAVATEWAQPSVSADINNGAVPPAPPGQQRSVAPVTIR